MLILYTQGDVCGELKILLAKRNGVIHQRDADNLTLVLMQERNIALY